MTLHPKALHKAIKSRKFWPWNVLCTIWQYIYMYNQLSYIHYITIDAVIVIDSYVLLKGSNTSQNPI